jgi:hypothetical protein
MDRGIESKSNQLSLMGTLSADRRTGNISPPDTLSLRSMKIHRRKRIESRQPTKLKSKRKIKQDYVLLLFSFLTENISLT